MVALRQSLIDPYRPDRTENLGDDTSEYSDQDVGKAVKLSGDTMVMCASGDEIQGFVASVNVGTTDGYSVGGVTSDVGTRQWALDEAGSLAVGGLVVAGTAGVLGTLARANVIAGTPTRHKWEVIRVDGTGAGRTVLLQKV